MGCKILFAILARVMQNIDWELCKIPDWKFHIYDGRYPTEYFTIIESKWHPIDSYCDSRNHGMFGQDILEWLILHPFQSTFLNCLTFRRFPDLKINYLPLIVRIRPIFIAAQIRMGFKSWMWMEVPTKRIRGSFPLSSLLSGSGRAFSLGNDLNYGRAGSSPFSLSSGSKTISAPQIPVYPDWTEPATFR